MEALHRLFNKNVKPVEIENTFIPHAPNHVCDQVRKQFFTTFNTQLLDRIRQIKLNNLNEKK